MKKAFKKGVILSVGVLWIGIASPLSADILYQNTTTLLQNIRQQVLPGQELGNEITLAETGNMKYFSFEYWGTNTLSPGNSSFQGNGNGPVSVDVKFYRNNGAPFNGYPTPNTLIYDTGFFAINPTPQSTLVYTLGDGLPLGGVQFNFQDITWSVQFENTGPNDSVGVDFYFPPTVGTSYGDTWENDGTGWVLDVQSPPASFGALMETPEPSSMMLSLLGGLGILIAVRRFRRKE
jgi:hypothetical protein